MLMVMLLLEGWSLSLTCANNAFADQHCHGLAVDALLLSIFVADVNVVIAMVVVAVS